jgi:hypothetical protein
MRSTINESIASAITTRRRLNIEHLVYVHEGGRRGADGTEGEGAVALEGGGGARPMRLTAFVFTLLGGAPLGLTAFVFTLPFLSAAAVTAGGVTAGGAAAAAGASKRCFGILFLFNGMAAEIMADTSPAFGGPPTGTSTTAGEGGAPPAVGGACGGSMAARSGRVVAGKGGAKEIGRRRLGFRETLRAQWRRECRFRPLFPFPPRTSRGQRPAS